LRVVFTQPGPEADISIRHAPLADRMAVTPRVSLSLTSVRSEAYGTYSKPLMTCSGCWSTGGGPLSNHLSLGHGSCAPITTHSAGAPVGGATLPSTNSVRGSHPSRVFVIFIETVHRPGSQSNGSSNMNLYRSVLPSCLSLCGRSSKAALASKPPGPWTMS